MLYLFSIIVILGLASVVHWRLKRAKNASWAPAAPEYDGRILFAGDWPEGADCRSQLGASVWDQLKEPVL